jgi:fructoselysine 6-kinase
MTLKVLGYGDNVVDHYLDQQTIYPGGNALNFAVNAFQNDVDAAYLGEFGNDFEGTHIKTTLEKIGIDISNCTQPEDAKTEKANVQLVEGDRVFVGAERGTRRAIQLTDQVLSYISGFSLIHSGCHAATEQELPKLGKVPILRSFDFSDPEKYRTNEYLERVAPHIDIAVFSCSDDSEQEMDRLLQRCTELGVTYILMTRGAKSPYFFIDKKKYAGEVEYLSDVKDTMGAGDAYLTTFMVSLLKSGWTAAQSPKEQQITQAFREAAKFSAEVCMTDGSFGYGITY